METIDLTPTWSNVLGSLIAVLEDGNGEGRKQAIAELQSMAKVADAHVEQSKKLCNGLSTYLETHFEVIHYLTETQDNNGSMAQNTMEHSGTGGMYELAESLTDEFEKFNEGTEWDGEFYDEVEAFLEKKEKEFLPEKVMTGKREEDEQ